MLQGIRELSNIAGIPSEWVDRFMLLGLALIIAKCIFPWTLMWKSEETKDENGKTTTKYYHIDL